MEFFLRWKEGCKGAGDRGIFVMAASRGTLAEETAEAYKDAGQGAEAVHQAGISRKVAKLRPWGVVKG